MLSLRRRLTLIHLTAVVVIVSSTALAGWWELSRSVRGQLDGALLALAETEVEMLAEAKGQPIRVHEAATGTAPPALGRLDRLVQIVNTDGHVLARSANLGISELPARPHPPATGAGVAAVFETLPNFSEEPLRMVSVPAIIDGKTLTVQVAGSLDDVNHVLQTSAILLAGMALALLGAVGIAGSVMTRKVFRAIDDVVHHAHRIGEASLSERLPHSGATDEIGHLVDTLNDMLDRLERAFDGQRRFTADASHELRSPLSRLRMEIEVTLRRPRAAPEYVDTLRSCMEEVERLTLLLEELLFLARLDAGQERGINESVSLNVLAEETMRRLASVASERGVCLVLDAGCPVSAKVAAGPASLVLTNLLDNALKFSPPQTRVTVKLSAESGNAVLCVRDQGPGISDADLPYLFDRFYRGASARAGTVDGMGLGLALAQAIARAWGGRIEGGNAVDGGACFRVYFPHLPG
jgi:two-component system OmpR family sensor kinase